MPMYHPGFANIGFVYYFPSLRITLFWLLLALVAFTFTACEEGASLHDMEASVEEAAEGALRGALEAPYGGRKV